MYVSSRNEIVDKLLQQLSDRSDDAPARKLEARVGEMFKKATDQAYDELFDLVKDCLLDNMKDAIRDTARHLAEQYIKSAIAGDEDTFGELFELRHNWQNAIMWSADWPLPLGVELRRKLLVKHHDLFENKVIADLEGELAALRKIKKLGAWRTMIEGDL